MPEEQAAQGNDDVLASIKELLRRKRVDLEELIIFCRQMYSLSKAGVPIIRAIGGLAERPDRLAAMAAAAKQAGRPDATRLLADLTEAIATGRTINDFREDMRR